jgi:hypothetical protein
MEIASNSLQVFYGRQKLNKEVDRDLLALMGRPTEVKKWLAASLDKTIRLQMDPPADIQKLSALPIPEPTPRKQ